MTDRTIPIQPPPPVPVPADAAGAGAGHTVNLLKGPSAFRGCPCGSYITGLTGTGRIQDYRGAVVKKGFVGIAFQKIK